MTSEQFDPNDSELHEENPFQKLGRTANDLRNQMSHVMRTKGTQPHGLPINTGGVQGINWIHNAKVTLATDTETTLINGEEAEVRQAIMVIHGVNEVEQPAIQAYTLAFDTDSNWLPEQSKSEKQVLGTSKDELVMSPHDLRGLDELAKELDDVLGFGELTELPCKGISKLELGTMQKVLEQLQT